MKKYLVEYNSNNSGGSWWLEDKDWKALEKAGWRLFGYDNFVYDKSTYKYDKNGLPVFQDGEKDNFLGAYANYAFKRFDNITDALQEFEKLTGQDISAEGCNCCGAPHSFSWEDQKGNRDYCSGLGCLEYLFPDKKIPKSIREALTQ